MLQRQINLLNKDPHQRGAAPVVGDWRKRGRASTNLRTNGGVGAYRWRGSRRLGYLFEIRLSDLPKKFFMKFLNNFITQLTAFFFYCCSGGYLRLRDRITVGRAWSRRLAAYKDLSAVERVATYYNQTQDIVAAVGCAC